MRRLMANAIFPAALLFFGASTVQQTLDAAEQHVVDAPYQPDYAKGVPERHLWHQLRKAFIRHRYTQILKRYRDKLRCDACISAHMDIAFSVDLAGQVNIHHIEKEQACGGNFPQGMREEFIHFLKSYPYPTSLKGTSVRLRLGRHVRC